MIVRKRWLGPERYVEVVYNRRRGLCISVEIFTPDPRKKQYHKPKWWCKSASYSGSVQYIREALYLYARKDREVIAEILDEIDFLNGISSDRRAAAS